MINVQELRVMENTGILRKHGIAFFVFLCLFVQGMLPQAADAHAEMVRIAVFPFNDIQSEAFDMNVAVVLRSELSRHDFIETVPVETIRERLYEIEPSYLWTEKRGRKKRGGILWRIEPEVVEEVRRKESSDFSIYGDLTRFRSRWRVDAYVLEGSDLKPKTSFTTTGSRDEEIPDRLAVMAKEIVDWLMTGRVLDIAEEEIRHYMGGLYTYSVVLEKIKKHVDSFSESIPLHALLLDLYLKEKEKYQDEIIKAGLKIITLYDPSGEEDIRYLLSLNIDPFEVTARVYENKKDWNKAIDVRNNALKLFPYRVDNHKIALGKDHYLFALSLEKRGEKAKALENYRRALIYLPRFSEDYKQAKEGLNRLEGYKDEGNGIKQNR